MQCFWFPLYQNINCGIRRRYYNYQQYLNKERLRQLLHYSYQQQWHLMLYIQLQHYQYLWYQLLVHYNQLLHYYHQSYQHLKSSFQWQRCILLHQQRLQAPNIRQQGYHFPCPHYHKHYIQLQGFWFPLYQNINSGIQVLYYLIPQCYYLNLSLIHI